jgi:hypothetical protein
MSRRCNVKQRLGQRARRSREKHAEKVIRPFRDGASSCRMRQSRGAESKEESDESTKGEP